MTQASQSILVVDDDPDIRQLLQAFLAQHGYRVYTARSGNEMFRVLKQRVICLIILDVMLPGADGFELCRLVRRDMPIPIIMLTASGEDTDRIVGLEMGADDYLAKPFNPRELLARIKAVLRRAINNNEIGMQQPDRIGYFAGWTLDFNSRCLRDKNQMEITLSSGEYDLLIAFLERPQHVLSRDQLMDITRSREQGPYDRSIDVQVSRLRQKIEVDPKNPQLIKTIRGGGYLFTATVKRE